MTELWVESLRRLPAHKHKEGFDQGLLVLVGSICSACIVNKNVHLCLPLGRGYSLLSSGDGSHTGSPANGHN